MSDRLVHLYLDARDRFVAGVLATDSADRVPSCPRWTIHDLLAHQLHQLAGMCDGTFPISQAMNALIDADSTARAHALREQEAWIEAGVEGLRAASSAQNVEAWTALSNRASPDALSGLVPDLAVHLLDLDAAIGRDSTGVDALLAEALEFWGFLASTRLANVGRDGLRLATPDGRTFGPSDADHVAVGALGDLLLTVTGRLDRDEAAARVRLPDDDVIVDHLALYGWPPARTAMWP